MPLGQQLVALLLLAIPIATISWTVTHEEIFREPREYCARKSRSCRHLYQRKFFYVFTCEYCFSHYVTGLALIATDYHLLYGDWRGLVVGGFALVWVANVYMGLFGRLRLDIRHERDEIALDEAALQDTDEPGGSDASAGN